MKQYEAIRKAIKAIIGKKDMVVFPAEVISVDEEKQLCDVKLVEDDLELYDVRLSATIDEVQDGVLIVPVVGSKVLVGMINGKLEDLYVCQYSAVDHVVMFDGSFGGFCKTPELKTQLDKMSKRIDDIIDAIKNGQTAAQDGGATLLASQTILLNMIIDKEDFSNIENEKLTHGE